MFNTTELIDRQRRVLASFLGSLYGTPLLKPETFLDRFPVERVMHALTEDERAEVLSFVTSLDKAVGKSLGPDIAKHLLETGLHVGSTRPGNILEKIPADLQVLRFPAPELWALILEYPFWGRTSEHAHFAHAKTALHALLTSALKEEFLSPTPFVRGPLATILVTGLPDKVHAELSRAFLLCREETEDRKIFEIIGGVSGILEYVPLSTIWSDVVLQNLVPRLGVLEDPQKDGVKKEQSPNAPKG